MSKQSKQSHDDDLFEAKKVVRKFSWKTYAENPDDELAKSLVAAEALDRQNEKDEAMLGEQWKRLFDPATSKAFGYVLIFTLQCDSLPHNMDHDLLIIISTQWKSRRDTTRLLYRRTRKGLQSIPEMPSQGTRSSHRRWPTEHKIRCRSRGNR